MRRKSIIKKPSFVKCLAVCAARVLVATLIILLIAGFVVRLYFVDTILRPAQYAEDVLVNSLKESVTYYYKDNVFTKNKFPILREQVLSLSDNYEVRLHIDIGGQKLLDNRVAAVYRYDGEITRPYYLLEDSAFYRSEKYWEVYNYGNNPDKYTIKIEDGYAYSDLSLEPTKLVVVDNETLEYVAEYTFDLNPNYENMESRNRVSQNRLGTNALRRDDKNAHLIFMGSNSSDTFYESNNEVFTITTTSGDQVAVQVKSDFTAVENKVEYETLHIMKTVVLVSAAFVIVVSFSVGLFIYSKEKNLYRMFEYRRKTTDAMAHDLKTPLAIASGYVENLKENINEDKRDYYLDEISQSIKYMNTLINDILEFSNSQYYSNKDSKEPLDVRAEIQSIINFLEPVYTTRKLTFDMYGDNTITTNRKTWNQALMNIISNSVKYANEGSCITIDIASSEIVISNAIKEDIKNVERLKEPFVKHNSERGENGGSGLGLAVADSNLEKLGFNLTLDSKDNKFIVRIR